jgi:hypothetical protein
MNISLKSIRFEMERTYYKLLREKKLNKVFIKKHREFIVRIFEIKKPL